MEWQPMETAPKDGSMILAYAYWVDDGKECGDYYVMVCWDEIDQMWNEGGLLYEQDLLTGWMPLPKKPEKKQNGKSL